MPVCLRSGRGASVARAAASACASAFAIVLVVVVALTAPRSAGAAAVDVLGAKPSAGGLGVGLPLPEAEAFRFEAIPSKAHGGVLMRFSMPKGYYLYRDRSSFRVEASPELLFAAPAWPEGVLHDDPHFGQVTIYFDSVDVPLALVASEAPQQPRRARLIATFQGCQDGGICYPPMTREVALALPAPSALAATLAAMPASAPAPAPDVRALPAPANAKLRGDDAGALAFTAITSGDALDRALRSAAAARRPVLLDFYADWCGPCRKMARETFTDARVEAALADFDVLKIDVTDSDGAKRALMRRFNVIGPPATLFFGCVTDETTALRLVGFEAPDAFLGRVARARACRT